MAIRGNTIGTPIKPEINLIKATDLTDKEKAQVLENIGAAPAGSGAGGSYVLTEEDKADIVSTVLGELPVYLGEVEIPGGEEQKYLYLMPEATTFDGTFFIATGVSVFDTPRDFTIYVDINATDDQGTDAIFIGGDYRMSDVFRVANQGGYMAVLVGGARQKTDSEISGNWNHKWSRISHIALVFKQGVFQFGKYRYSTNGSVSNINATENLVYKKLDCALTIGAQKASDGVNYLNPWKGTVNDFRIYNRAMTEDEVLALMPSSYALNGEVE